MWAATGSPQIFRIKFIISIHAARVGSDRYAGPMMGHQNRISIHAARVGSDYSWLPHIRRRCYYFNPRCPCGQRLSLFWFSATDWLHFNPRCPCGQRPGPCEFVNLLQQYFNPRCPCGQRPVLVNRKTQQIIFQSTLPVWAATAVVEINHSKMIFQSTLPVWAATDNCKRLFYWNAISIHAARVGSDLLSLFIIYLLIKISIHAARVGSDAALQAWGRVCFSISIHAARVGSDPAVVINKNFC